MTELNLGDELKVGDVIVSGRFDFIVCEVGEFTLARHKNMTLMLPTVYNKTFTEEDEFGLTYRTYRN